MLGGSQAANCLIIVTWACCLSLWNKELKKKHKKCLWIISILNLHFIEMKNASNLRSYLNNKAPLLKCHFGCHITDSCEIVQKRIKVQELVTIYCRELILELLLSWAPNTIITVLVYPRTCPFLSCRNTPAPEGAPISFSGTLTIFLTSFYRKFAKFDTCSAYKWKLGLF